MFLVIKAGLSTVCRFFTVYLSFIQQSIKYSVEKHGHNVKVDRPSQHKEVLGKHDEASQLSDRMVFRQRKMNGRTNNHALMFCVGYINFS